jgi:hypothetical protein
MVEKKKIDKEQNDAAVKIQARWKGKQEREKFEEKKKTI